MCLRFTGKTIEKTIKFSLSNGLEPTTHETKRMPISNRLHPKEFSERDRCAIGWSRIWDHSTNPVNDIQNIHMFIGTLATGDESRVDVRVWTAP